MTLIVRHYGKIENGKKTYFNPVLYKQQMDGLEGQEFEEVIKKRHRKVSSDAHAFYRGAVLGTCLQHEAFSHYNKADDIHEDVIAPMFLGYTKHVVLGNKQWEEKKVRSTSSLNKEEMGQFIDKVIAWLLMEFGIEILSPENYYLSLYIKTDEK